MNKSKVISNLRYGLYVIDKDFEVINEYNTYIKFEAASLIKIPIAFQALLRRKRSSLPYLRKKRHDSTGSGIIHWTHYGLLKFDKLIQFALTYSDCVAANMLLDIAGGQDDINKWLKNEGYNTVLLLPYIKFPNKGFDIPFVGTTSAKDMTLLVRNFLQYPWPPKTKNLIVGAMADLHKPWFRDSKLEQVKGRYKTGSLVRYDQAGNSVLNVTGCFVVNNQERYFTFLSKFKTYNRRAARKEICRLLEELLQL